MLTFISQKKNDTMTSFCDNGEGTQISITEGLSFLPEILSFAISQWDIVFIRMEIHTVWLILLATVGFNTDPISLLSGLIIVLFLGSAVFWVVTPCSLRKLKVPPASFSLGTFRPSLVSGFLRNILRYNFTVTAVKTSNLTQFHSGPQSHSSSVRYKDNSFMSYS
jgi:hypothetical protein